MWFSLFCVVSLCSFGVQSQNVSEILFTSGLLVNTSEADPFFKNSVRYSPEVVIDSRLTLLELIRKNNYTVTDHIVQTEDGYLLSLYRMENSSRRNDSERKKIPVLVMPGLCDSSAMYVVLGPKHSLSYYLADRGYDVWLANFRDSRLPGKHIRLSADQAEYWQFSFHEIGFYDIPAMIDYILKETKVPKVQLIGYSQGTTAFFVMASERTGYNDKILSMHAMAPVAFENEMTSPWIVFYRPFFDYILDWLNFWNVNEVSFNNHFGVSVFNQFCSAFHFVEVFCANMVFSMMGANPDQLNIALAPVISAHLPSPTSVKILTHHAQLVKSGKFHKFDYGYYENMKRYNSSQPPQYNLSKITSRVNLIYSTGDVISSLDNVKKIKAALPNLGSIYMVPNAVFGHVDYFLSRNLKSLVHDELYATMRHDEKLHEEGKNRAISKDLFQYSFKKNW